MKIEDIRVGMKVVPHSKTAGSGKLRDSPVWKLCREKHQPYMIVTVIREDGRITCDEYESNTGDFFDISDLTPYVENYTCNIPGVTVDLIPGKEYWVSDTSRECAIQTKTIRKYMCTVKGTPIFEASSGTAWVTWKYNVDPDTYEEPETEMTIEEIAEALRKSGAIKGKLKIKK